MAKLGYTWYPKDWKTNEKVFNMSLELRGFYREIIDYAYENDNQFTVEVQYFCRMMNINKRKFDTLFARLLSDNMIIFIGDKYQIPSVEPRMQLIRGGRISKPNTKPIPKPIAKPNPKQRERERERERESKGKLFKPDFESFISSCFKYLGMSYTQGDPSRHGIESPIRKWLLSQDPNIQLKNLNAYMKVTPEKKFRAKTIEKLLEKLEGYNFCQDVSNYVAPVINGQPKKTKEQLESDRKEELEIRKVYELAKKGIGQ